MPSYSGPYLAPPEKPQVDPAVLHLVDLSKGNIVPAPGWGGGPATPGGLSIASTGGASTGGAAAQMLSLPNQVEEEITSSGRCLSPAAHKAGQLTYGIYEGGGVTKANPVLPISPVVRRAGWRQPVENQEEEEEGKEEQKGASPAISEGAEEEPTEAKEISQLQAQDGDVGRAGGGGGDRVAETVAKSALPTAKSPTASAVPTVRVALSREPAGGDWNRVTVGSPREGDGGGSSGRKDSVEDQARRRREATARSDTEMEVALWIEGTTGETFPGKFWTSLKDGGEAQIY